ncbi:hypothetical protein R8Z50_22675 [Longispora sp. K20-0274]|uniref:hypothetical protein n=1 Tax=Longispora sp. K20-0274 TaxID=3088255 RepID=UPI00399AC800
MSNLARVLTVVLLPALAACGANDPAPKPAPTATAPSTTPATADPVAAARQQVEDAYRGMWAAYTAASRIPDPQHADLARYTSGKALEVLTKGVQSAKDKGLRERGDVVLQPSVGGLQDASVLTKATVNDCIDTSQTSFYKIDGSAYQDSPGGKRAMLATVEKVEGIWKVVSFGLREVGTCA